MQVLYLTPCAQMGGAERSLLDCMASLRAAQPRWQLDLIAGEDGPLLSEAREAGVRAHCLPFPRRFARLGAFGTGPAVLARQSVAAFPGIAKYRRDLHQTIHALAPDVIHTNGLKMHLLGAWDGGAPVVWHVHDYLSSRPTPAHAMRLSAKRVSAVLANSHSVAADAQRLFGNGLAVETMLNGVDLGRFHPHGPRVDLDALAGMAPAISGTVRIGLVGTFAKWKGHQIFLRAMARPEFRALQARAYIVGGPIYQTSNSQFSFEELRAMARDLGIASRVGFTGFVSNIPDAMRSLDIVVHASTAPEPFGLVIAEAMACGRAVIASNAGGAAEIVRNEQDGISIAPGNHRVLAAAIRDLLRDPVKRMCLSSAARTTAEARFDRTRLGPALSAFYCNTLNIGNLESCASSTSIAEIGTAA
jgi:glycosyltransferase involved in cell wall biosynthesis